MNNPTKFLIIAAIMTASVAGIITCAYRAGIDEGQTRAMTPQTFLAGVEIGKALKTPRAVLRLHENARVENVGFDGPVEFAMEGDDGLIKGCEWKYRPGGGAAIELSGAGRVTIQNNVIMTEEDPTECIVPWRFGAYRWENEPVGR